MHIQCMKLYHNSRSAPKYRIPSMNSSYRSNTSSMSSNNAHDILTYPTRPINPQIQINTLIRPKFPNPQISLSLSH